PITAEVEDGWLIAKETTLGADDGIGMAIQLALLADNTLEHGPIECLFTVDEETGLTGAKELKDGWLKGKMLLNLDSEDEGQFFIGCAGGIDTVVNMDFEWVDVTENSVAYKVDINGFMGGHSGDDINRGRGNATKQIARLLYELTNRFDVELAYIDAGNLRNAIAREAYVHVTFAQEDEEVFLEYIKAFDGILKNEYRITDPNVVVSAEKIDCPSLVIDQMTTYDLIWSLYACPHGVLAMAQDIKDFVETSTNLASVKMIDDKIKITTSQRSSVESKKYDACLMVASVFEMVGAEVEHGDGYPGWNPNPNSEVLKVLKCAYEKLYNKEPEVLAIIALCITYKSFFIFFNGIIPAIASFCGFFIGFLKPYKEAKKNGEAPIMAIIWGFVGGVLAYLLYFGYSEIATQSLFLS
ncbi:MAG: beta-Ala-His dipeptidase, partial [Sphingobacteriia bacterium]|nr:beta-Ala-His dipeptidase [Sphingobacteriia bacterium]